MERHGTTMHDYARYCKGLDVFRVHRASLAGGSLRHEFFEQTTPVSNT